MQNEPLAVISSRTASSVAASAWKPAIGAPGADLWPETGSLGSQVDLISAVVDKPDMKH